MCSRFDWKLCVKACLAALTSMVFPQFSQSSHAHLDNSTLTLLYVSLLFHLFLHQTQY